MANLFTEFQVGSLTLKGTQVGNVIYFHDIQGKGNVRDFCEVISRVKDIAKEFDVFLAVEFSNPRFEQLMNVYARKGAVPQSVLMKVNP